MATNEYPIIDFSEIPGCESPVKSSTIRKVTNSTKSRISSIFSSTLDSIEDDPFDLKSSTRKRKPVRQSIVNTARLVDIESPNALTDWHRLRFEAQLISSEIDDKEKGQGKPSRTCGNALHFLHYFRQKSMIV